MVKIIATRIIDGASLRSSVQHFLFKADDAHRGNGSSYFAQRQGLRSAEMKKNSYLKWDLPFLLRIAVYPWRSKSPEKIVIMGYDKVYRMNKLFLCTNFCINKIMFFIFM